MINCSCGGSYEPENQIVIDHFRSKLHVKWEKLQKPTKTDTCIEWLLDMQNKLLKAKDESMTTLTSDECFNEYIKWTTAPSSDNLVILSKNPFHKVIKEYLGEPLRLRKVLSDDERKHWETKAGVKLPEDKSKRCSIYYREISAAILTEKLKDLM